MSVEECPAALDVPGYWAALEARYAPLLLDHLGLEAPLREVAGYALGHGKRLRPLLAELVGRAAGGPPAAVTQVAIAVEFLHTASLLLDDLPCMDDAVKRRGGPPAHHRFSEAEAILTAVALTSRSYALLLAAPVSRPDVNREMARLACETVAGAMALGQVIELRRDEQVSPDDVRRIHDQKTASLFELTGRLVIACSGASPGLGRVHPLVLFTTLLGRAYQIIDDLEDRDERAEVRVNLACVAGSAAAVAEARGLLRAARRTLVDFDGADELRSCVDWFDRRLDVSS